MAWQGHVEMCLGEDVPDERIDITKKNEHLVLTDSQPIICHKMTNEAPLMFSLPVIMKSISYWMNALMPTAGNFVAFLMLVLLHSSVTQFRTDLLEHSHDQQKKVLMSPDELTELLNFYHSTPVCGYSSVSTTLAKILQDYTWNGVKDVIEYTR